VTNSDHPSDMSRLQGKAPARTGLFEMIDSGLVCICIMEYAKMLEVL
jgi:hypothetical protein